jgi:hypothetical protein
MIHGQKVLGSTLAWVRKIGNSQGMNGIRKTGRREQYDRCINGGSVYGAESLASRAGSSIDTNRRQASCTCRALPAPPFEGGGSLREFEGERAIATKQPLSPAAGCSVPANVMPRRSWSEGEVGVTSEVIDIGESNGSEDEEKYEAPHGELSEEYGDPLGSEEPHFMNTG